MWHCHMIEHEDHDMMRPFKVRSPDDEGKRVVVDGADLTGNMFVPTLLSIRATR